MINKKVYEILDKNIIKRISIDIDSYKEVPRTLVRCLEIFNPEQIKLFVTASKTGFRIEIHGEFTPLENIYYRCLLDDDPYRLRFAIKRFLSTGNPDLLDIAFFYKEQIKGYANVVSEINIYSLVDKETIEKIRKQTIDFDKLYDELEKRLLNYVDKITLWTIVIPAKEEYIKKIYENFRKYKILKDPYYDDRVIFYKVSREDLVEKFKELGIEVITYKIKEISKKEVDITEEFISF